MEFFTKFLDKFEQFVKRAMMPSIVFFIIFTVLFSIALYIKSDFKSSGLDEIIKYLLSINLNIGNLVVFFILLIGISHILAMLTQMIFDNFIKRNYNTKLKFTESLKDENNNLESLRSKVINKLKKEEKLSNLDEYLIYNDFMLYQFIGRKLEYLDKPTSTSRYVDDTKASGIIFVSLMISILFIFPTIFFSCWIILHIILVAISWFIGYEHIKSKYRSRALRIYTNYILGDEEKKTDKENSKNEFSKNI